MFEIVGQKSVSGYEVIFKVQTVFKTFKPFKKDRAPNNLKAINKIYSRSFNLFVFLANQILTQGRQILLLKSRNLP